MNKRTPYAAGLFYLGYEEGLTRDVKKYLKTQGEREKKIRAKGIVVPHAGYEYSGPVAGSVYGAIEAPKRFIIIGPNHSGFGFPISIEDFGTWKTPLGDVEIDENLAADMMANSKNIKVSYDAHRLEHSVEVQLPFLQYLYGSGFKFVPICFQLQDFASAEEVGNALVEVLAERNAVIIASSDFTHYEPQANAARKDNAALKAVEALDAKQFLTIIESQNVTACGYGPIATVITAAKGLLAKEAKLLQYKTSGDITGDKSSVVGYAAVSFRK